ncbi:hypothetical protein [Geobacillus kaustophilus]|uniref:hypothetical protein n=1 Tax=Geobacillus kaustophilus TaxID=1462 RepID=UPI0027DBDAC6|nr:hypothetical protein [Geobacillus kaustophilus]WMJ20356.1 hypothetical protein RA957_01955 [Geobacillus kaustophilus]
MLRIESVIIKYLEKHPGASAQKIFEVAYLSNHSHQQSEKSSLQSIVYKKLRTLKREQ